jgi:hypothetical protein
VVSLKYWTKTSPVLEFFHISKVDFSDAYCALNEISSE